MEPGSGEADPGASALPVVDDKLSLVAEESPIDLGAIPVGDLAPRFNWRIHNVSPEPAEDLSWITSSPQVVLSSDCGNRLEPAKECTVNIDYTQAVVGAQTASVQLRWATGELILPFRSTGHGYIEVFVRGQGRVVSETVGIDCPGNCRAAVMPGITVELTTTPDPNWLRAPGPSDNCGRLLSQCDLQSPQIGATEASTLNVDFYEFSHNLIFLSSQTYPPTLGSVAAYDAACNTLATAAGLNTPDGQGYLAALSDSDGPFWQRFAPGVRGWTTLNAKPFADTIPRLIDQAVVYNSVRFTERFEEIFPVLEETLSGTLSDGSVGLHCDNWSSSAGEYSAARPPYRGPGGWMGLGELPVSGARDCDPGAPRRITCMGNTRTAPLDIDGTEGKKIWLTNDLATPGQTSPDQLCQQDRPVDVSASVALLAHPGHSAAELLDRDAVYVRPNGIRVGTGAEIVRATISSSSEERPRLESGIWQSGNGAYLRVQFTNLSVWSGSSNLIREGTLASTCNDWQSSSENDRANIGLLGVLHSQLWSRGGDGPCSTPSHFYCIEQ